MPNAARFPEPADREMIFVPRHQDRTRVISDGSLNEDEEVGH